MSSLNVAAYGTVVQTQSRRAPRGRTVHVLVRDLREADIPEIVAAFARIGWNKPAEQYQQYVGEQSSSRRDVLVAVVDDAFAGYVTILWESSYAPFRDDGIPEISDFNVLPNYRRRGIGTRLMDEAEARIARRWPVAGIGVGMGPDYGAAQRLYTKRGYAADGRGLTSHGQPVTPGQTVIVDDDLVLYFTREVRF